MFQREVGQKSLGCGKAMKMVKWLFGVVGRLVGWVFYAVGALVVLVAVGLWAGSLREDAEGGDSKEKEGVEAVQGLGGVVDGAGAVPGGVVKEWKEDARPAVVAAEPVAALPVGDACRCNAGAWCEGPRGGIYCLTDDGGKRYKAKK